MESSDSSSNVALVREPSENTPVIMADRDLYQLCLYYIKTKNVNGLALIARQKGIPPFLRNRAWPLLLKGHPFVMDPYITPDAEIEAQDDTDDNGIPVARIRKDLRKYVRKSHHHADEDRNEELESVQNEMLAVVEKAVCRFLKKWGTLINYDPGLVWAGLGLAEWVAPIPGTTMVFCGRDEHSDSHIKVKDISQDFGDLEVFSDPKMYLNSALKFHEVYERLILVILHSPEPETEISFNDDVPHSDIISNDQLHNLLVTLPTKGGSPDERISFFLYCFRRLLPELSRSFAEENILDGNNVKDEWIFWWLKWCGSKVWSRIDRGRLWDSLLGWRNQLDIHSVNELDALKLDNYLLADLGPDLFWNPLTFSDEQEIAQNCKLPLEDGLRSKTPLSIRSLIDSLSMVRLTTSSAEDSKEFEKRKHEISEIPKSHLNPHTELVFITIAFLKAKEGALLELDQSEIREFLSKTSSTNLESFQKLFETDNHHINLVRPLRNHGNHHDLSETVSETSSVDFSETDSHVSSPPSTNRMQARKSKDLEDVLLLASDLWKKWLWQEIHDN